MMCIMANVCMSQNISVSSFRILDTDLTANTAGTMEVDQNGETAALIKVVTTQTGFTFDGGALGIVKTVQKPSEVWVYVPRGLKKITISHPQLGMLRDYYLNIPIEAARTYEMILTTGTVQTIVNQARTSQYVVFQLSPTNAVVELDGELLETTDGIATKMMKFGTYNYRVQAPSYLPEAGNITVKNPQNKHIFNISLKPNFSVVNISVDNEAEIWVNGELKGVGTWTGNLGAGTYELESRKQNHRTVSITRDIIVTKEPQTIRLQAPTPIYGDADINSAPAMADIYIDGKEVGQTPLLIQNLLIGEHELRVKKEGYNDYVNSLFVKENEVASASITLDKQPKREISEPLEISIRNVRFKMIAVNGGKFYLNKKCKVELSSFYIGETEVTQELWEAVMGDNPSNTKSPDRPVEQVSWNDCQDFIKKLNNLTGKNFSLPTEAEWEFAARGGNESKRYKYSGSNNSSDVAWEYNNSFNVTHIVKQKQPNELGLYDMTGNVWEWCFDWYGKIDYLTEVKNPKGPLSGIERVRRGGCMRLNNTDTLHRGSYPPSHKEITNGLRLALHL